MTISSTTRKAGPFTGTGATATFPFTFKVFNTSDLEVVRLEVATTLETTLTLTTDYTVSLNQDQDANPGGSITLVAGALASGYTLVITSDVANLQPTDLTNQGGFYPEVINDALDRTTIQLQQIQEKVDRSAKLPITSAADADALVADIVRIADSADNLDTVATNIDDVNTTADDIANVNTVAGSISNVNTVSGSISNVNTTATNIADVNTVAGEIGAGQDVTVVAANITAVSTNASSITDINTNATNIAAINTVSADITDVTTVSGSISNVNTTATNISSVNTVAAELGAGQDVTVVAANISNVNTTAGSIANVNTTATNIADVNTVAAELGTGQDVTVVADNIADVTTVAGIQTNVSAVAAIDADVTTVAGISSNVTTVAGIDTDVTTVASNATDIQTVADQIDNNNLQTIAADIAQVITVANDLNEAVSEIDTVANNITDVNTVGTDIANVNTVATNIADVNTVAGIDTDVSAVAAIDADVTTVAGIDANVTTVAGISSNVSTVAGIDANVTTVAGISSDVTTVASISSDVTVAATNVADITNFADVYIGPSATPPTTRADSSALQVGDMYFDTATNTMKVYSSGGWISTGSSVNGTAARFKYVATAGQTTFTGTDANGNTLAYDSGYIDVYLNGVHLDPSDYTATSGTSVVLGSAAALDDELYIVAFGTFALANFSIGDANDVNLSGVSDGQVLIYNGTSGDFEGGTIDLSSKVSKTGDTMTGTYDFGGFISLQTSDTGGYPRINGNSSSAQLGLFRSSGGSEGGFYLGGDADQFSVWSSNFVRRMNIDSAGRVTKPYQPAFLGRGRNSVLSALGTFTPINFSSISLNTGSHWDNSTGIFTAPVDGNYLVQWTVGNQGAVNSGAYVGIYILVNGSGYLSAWSLNTGYDSTAHCGGVIPLAASDTVRFAYHNTYGVPPTNIEYTHATCYLIG